MHTWVIGFLPFISIFDKHIVLSDMDKYKNFKELKNNEDEGRDYIIRYRNTEAEIAVMAPHGGGIEPGTLDLADEIAGKEFMFYSFSGIKIRGNNVLHLTSTRFDEPAALEIARKAYTVITLHGCRERSELIYTGGKNLELIHAMSERLADAGFNVKKSQDDELKGKSKNNICNRCRSGRGVQMEISTGLRKKMFGHNDSYSAATRTEEFYKFVNSVREVLLSVHK